MAKNFSARMRSIGDLLVVNAENTVKKAAMAASEAAIMTTPVKTGNARTNWRVSFARPSTALEKAPNTPNVDTNRQVASARALIEAANKIKGWKMLRSGNILIVNPVDYILDLDRGTSTQAMDGMSKFAIAAAKAELRKGRLLRRGG